MRDYVHHAKKIIMERVIFWREKILLCLKNQQKLNPDNAMSSPFCDANVLL